MSNRYVDVIVRETDRVQARCRVRLMTREDVARCYEQIRTARKVAKRHGIPGANVTLRYEVPGVYGTAYSTSTTVAVFGGVKATVGREDLDDYTSHPGATVRLDLSGTRWDPATHGDTLGARALAALLERNGYGPVAISIEGATLRLSPAVA